jgi:hypothetical protein
LNRIAEVVFEEAIRLVTRHQIATCSFLQRRLGVGYADAQSILAQLRRSNRLTSVRPRITVAEIADKWTGKQRLARGTVSSVTAGFFEVDSGISFSSTDLYCALIGSKDADDLSVAYGMARANGSRRASSVVMTILDSLGDDTHVWPADGIVLKITSDPTRLLGHEVRQISSTLRGHTTQHCVTALAIQYDGQGDDLVLEAIASRINSR